ncbi:unnamed protein product [Allacma fusca]|uniref:Uncharacterized protein n=1 Tax=Allacma fusca TaxID=39272 RepID=A0A8J2NMT8_9HEXA|nr:unnamed protein product [Allacma fusca]
MFSETCHRCSAAVTKTSSMITNLSSHINFSVSSKNSRLINCRCHTHPVSNRSGRKHHSTLLDSGWRPFLHLFLGLLIFHPRTAMSSPLRKSGSSSSSTDLGEHIRHQRPAKWINPCRIPTTIPALPSDFEVQQQSDVDIFQNIITQVSKAEHQAREFMGAFFEESFGTKLKNDKYKDIHQDWIGNVAVNIGKYLGEEVDPEKLDALTVKETLRSMYEGLQKFAVGLEQIVLDQAVYGGNFHQHFHEAEFQLKYVLCELQIAMLEKSISHEDITREIMSQTYRDLDDRTARNLRDWLIFRDYVNVLEYLKQVFKYFLEKSKIP